jgi:predicted ABC-type ATPase
MTNPSDRLDPEEHARIFAEKVVPNSGLNEALSHERPKAIILGGQPGAGKGNLMRAAEAELHGDVVKIDPDAQRENHSRIKEFQSENPYTWSDRTHADASQWAIELRDGSIAGKKNFIFDTTLSNGQSTASLIKKLQAKGV